LVFNLCPGNFNILIHSYNRIKPSNEKTNTPNNYSNDYYPYQTSFFRSFRV